MRIPTTKLVQHPPIPHQPMRCLCTLLQIQVDGLVHPRSVQCGRPHLLQPEPSEWGSTFVGGCGLGARTRTPKPQTPQDGKTCEIRSANPSPRLPTKVWYRQGGSEPTGPPQPVRHVHHRMQFRSFVYSKVFADIHVLNGCIVEFLDE